MTIRLGLIEEQSWSRGGPNSPLDLSSWIWEGGVLQNNVLQRTYLKHVEHTALHAALALLAFGKVALPKQTMTGQTGGPTSGMRPPSMTRATDSLRAEQELAKMGKAIQVRPSGSQLSCNMSPSWFRLPQKPFRASCLQKQWLNAELGKQCHHVVGPTL